MKANMKVKQIKFWARLGQIAFFVYEIFDGMFEIQLPRYVPPEFSGTVAEFIYVILSIAGLIIFSEAIVRLIGYFAELLERK